MSNGDFLKRPRRSWRQHQRLIPLPLRYLNQPQKQETFLLKNPLPALPLTPKPLAFLRLGKIANVTFD